MARLTGAEMRRVSPRKGHTAKDTWNPNGRLLGMVKSNGIWVALVVTGIKKNGNDKIQRKDRKGAKSTRQIWSVPANVHPGEYRGSKDLSRQAVRISAAVCFDCPQQHVLGGGCYVRNDPIASIWKCLQRGGYKPATAADYPGIFGGAPVRFGAFGEVVGLLPLDNARQIAALATVRTGYTHRWKDPRLQGWRDLVMASVEGSAAAEAADALGWRYFRVRAPGSAPAAGEVNCPTERVGCDDCGLCKGKPKDRGPKNVSIPAHGTWSAAALVTIGEDRRAA